MKSYVFKRTRSINPTWPKIHYKNKIIYKAYPAWQVNTARPDMLSDWCLPAKKIR